MAFDDNDFGKFANDEVKVSEGIKSDSEDMNGVLGKKSDSSFESNRGVKSSENDKANFKDEIKKSILDDSKGDSEGSSDKKKLKKAGRVQSLLKGGFGKLKSFSLVNKIIQIALLVKIFNVIKSFFVGIFHAIKSFFSSIVSGIMAFGAFLAKTFGLSAVAGTVMSVVTCSLLTIMPVILSGLIILNNTIGKLDASPCIPTSYSSGVNSASEQSKNVVKTARKLASEKPHYTYNANPNKGSIWTLTKKRGGAGIDSGAFVQTCFHKSDSPVLTKSDKHTTVKALYKATKKYQTKNFTKRKCKETDLFEGDVLFFGSKSHPFTHIAIYIGGGEIAHASSDKISKGSPYADKSGYIGVTITPVSYAERKGVKLQFITRPYKTIFKDGDSSKDIGDEGGSGGSRQQEEFIKEVAKHARDTWRKCHIYPSTLIAQACIESAYGTSNICKSKGNYYGLGAYDSSPYASAHKYISSGKYKGLRPSTFGAAKNYWTGATASYASCTYWDVIKQTNPIKQAVYAGKSPWSSAGYGGRGNGKEGSSLISLIKRHNLTKYNRGLKSFTPDKSKYGGSGSSLDGGDALDNSVIADMKSDDGCGGEKDDHNEDDVLGLNSQKFNGKNATILSFSMRNIARVGKQAPAECGSWSIAYGRTVIDGKVRYGHTYISGNWGAGGATRLKTYSHNASGVSERNRDIYNEIKNNKKPVIINMRGWGSYSWGNNHFMSCVGYRKGVTASTIKWGDLVVIDPADGRVHFMGELSGSNKLSGVYRAPIGSSYGVLLRMYSH